MTQPLEDRLSLALENGAGVSLRPGDVAEVCRWLNTIRHERGRTDTRQHREIRAYRAPEIRR